ncbi:MAG: hypothetical protein ACLRFI_01740 [Alphaproteobacteria bacterium]
MDNVYKQVNLFATKNIESVCSGHVSGSTDITNATYFELMNFAYDLEKTFRGVKFDVDAMCKYTRVRNFTNEIHKQMRTCKQK